MASVHMPSLSLRETPSQAINHDHAHAAHGDAHGDPDHAGAGDDGAGPAREASQVHSDDDDEDSDDESEEDEEEEARLGPIERLKHSLRAKQQKWMDARRDPLLEWKEEERWKREHESYRIAAEEARLRQEALDEEKQATKERKHKRKAQQKVTRQKAREFRETLYQYEQDVIKSEKRAQVISAFQREDRRKQKAAAAEAEDARKLEEKRIQEEQLAAALAQDEQTRQAVCADLASNIHVADEIGRRYGMLPAINTPPAHDKGEQDETSSVLILRLNPIPADQPAPLSAPPSSTAKRLVFTVNMKRFKHVEEIRGESIGDHGGLELARALLTGACPRVKAIYLGWNHIKYSAMVALSDCFVRGACGQLYVLDLRCNSIDANGVTQLLGALDQGGLPELRELILQGNVLGDEGARAFAHAMLRGTLKLLRVIDIRQNRIRNAGVLALWNVFTSEGVLKFCPKLQLLDMRRNEAQGSLTRSFLPCPSYLEF